MREAKKHIIIKLYTIFVCKLYHRHYWRRQWTAFGLCYCFLSFSPSIAFIWARVRRQRTWLLCLDHCVLLRKRWNRVLNTCVLCYSKIYVRELFFLLLFLSRCIFIDNLKKSKRERKERKKKQFMSILLLCSFLQTHTQRSSIVVCPFWLYLSNFTLLLWIVITSTIIISTQPFIWTSS